jgi:hypothetical protein
MVNFTLEQPTKAQRGSKGIAYSIFNLGTRWEWVVNATVGPLYTSGKSRYPLCRRLGEPQSRSGRVQKISPPTGIRSPDRPARTESELYSSTIGATFAIGIFVKNHKTKSTSKYKIKHQILTAQHFGDFHFEGKSLRIR